MCVANVTVEGTLCAKQVEGIVLARIPKDLASVHLERDAKNRAVLVLLLDSGANLIAQGQRIRTNHEIAILFRRCEGRYRQIAIDDSKGGTVFEETRGAVLNANKSWRQDGETSPSARHNSPFLGQRIPFLSCVNK